MGSISMIRTVDDLLLERAHESNQTPLVAYPKTKDGLIDFRLLTAKDLNDFTDRAAMKLMTQGLKMLQGNESETIGLLGPSDLEFMITMFALSRLGYTILILSPRLAIDAHAALLRETGCSTICYAPVLEQTVRTIQKTERMRALEILSQSDFDDPDLKPLHLEVDKERTSTGNKVAFIMHSSGSTGRPKPIFQSHEACLGNYAMGHEMRSFLTVPLYHTHGHACLYRAIYNRSTLYFLNAKLPVTATNLIAVMEYAEPGVVFTVPYALKLFAESERGIQALRDCKLVSSAGSQIPDELGDRLVAKGVQLVSHWGSTETGALMSSMRPKDDKDWAYMQIFPSAEPYVLMKPLGDAVHELVVLDGLKSKIVSNSDDPPNSFHTKDTFVVHPTKPNRWKYIGRLDDRITLINGEKVLPTLFEGLLREDPLIKEAVIFGVGRALPGLLLFRSELAAGMSDQGFVDHLWPTIEKLNSKVESFAHITRDTIVPLGAKVEYPCTDKGTIVRPQVYKVFEKVIDDVYEKLDGSAEGSLRMDQANTEQFIIDSFKDDCSINLPTAETDFFTAGADSLDAIKMSSFLRKTLYLGSGKDDLRPSTIFEQATARRLATYLIRLQNSEGKSEEDDTEVMTSMIKKYSTFKQVVPDQSNHGSARSSILTGATGSLGIHILSSLLREPDHQKVYCLVRATTPEEATKRVLTAFTRKGIPIPANAEHRIIALPSDLSREDLGVEPNMFREMRKNVHQIIHNAWAVNFNLGLRSFEDQHIRGTYNLINFALSVEAIQPASFVFCSSISVASRISPSITIQESLVEDLKSANMGYGQSKLVTEHIVHNAALETGIKCCVIRIGQIVGDSEMGLWNDSESIPLIIRSALTLGCLPNLNEFCWWLPVDFVAKAIVELGRNATVDSGETTTPHCHFSHVINPHGFSWTHDLLPKLHNAGLSFEVVSPQEWVARLRTSEQDPERNPTIKLMSTYENKYGENDGQQDGCQDSAKIHFYTTNTQAASLAMRAAPDIIKGGFVKKFVARWLEKWRAETPCNSI